MTDLEKTVIEAIRLVCLFRESERLYPPQCDELELQRLTRQLSVAERSEALQALEAAGLIRRGRTINRDYYVHTIKQETTMSKSKMNEYHEALKTFLDRTAQTDSAFAAKYAAKIEKDGGVEKSIKGCGDYIASEVHKHKARKVWTDPEIYGMAMHYYDEGLKPPKSVPGFDVVVTKPELTEADKARLEKEAREAVEADFRRQEELRLRAEAEKAEKRQKQAEERARAAEQKKREALEAKRKAMEAEATLFSFEEE